MFLLFYLLLVLSWFLFEIDKNLHTCLAMSIDKLVGVIVFLEGETVAYQWLEVDDALVYVIDGCEIILVAVHHRTDESQLVLAQIEHAEGRVLGKDSHNHDVATFLDGLHQRTDGNLYTSYLETYLIAFLTEEILSCLLQGFLGDVEGVLDSALTSLGQAEVAYIGNEYVLGTTCNAELGNEVADGSCAADYYILSLHIGAVAGMGTNGSRLDHCPEVEAHAFWQLSHAVVIYNEEVLCCSVSLESLNTQVFTDIILSSLARVTLAANQLWASGDVVARLADGNFAAYCHNYSRVLMSLNHWVEGGWVKTVVRVNLATADADALDVDENLMSS